MKDKIHINGRFLSQKISGVQKFAWGVSNALSQMNYDVIFLSPQNTISEPNFGTIVPVGKLKGHAWEQIDLPLYLKKNNIQKLLNLCNTAPLISNCQYITIHDLAFKEHPEWFNPKFSKWYNWLLPKIAKRAKHIFTVSEFSKREIAKSYSISNNKITVVPNGIYWPQKIIEKPKEVNYGNFILAVGSDNPRKNYKLLIAAFESLKPKNTKLVIVGSHSVVFKSSTKKESENIIWLNEVEDSFLQELYKNAKLTVCSSLYEGFGLPILESLYFQCPVLVNDLEVFKEIFGNHIYYYNKNDAQDLKNQMKLLLLKKSGVLNTKPLLEKLNYLSGAQKIADTYLIN